MGGAQVSLPQEEGAKMKNAQVEVTTGLYHQERGTIVQASGPYVIVNLDRGGMLIVLREHVRYVEQCEQQQNLSKA